MRSKKGVTPKGFNCTTCDKWHEYNFWVAAHWSMLIKHTCGSCGAKHDIIEGVATLTRKGRKKLKGRRR